MSEYVDKRKIHGRCPDAENLHRGLPDQEKGDGPGDRAAVLHRGQSRGYHPQGAVPQGAGGKSKTHRHLPASHQEKG